MPPFTIFNPKKEAVAGDTFLTNALRMMADRIQGYIVDNATGETVYSFEELVDEGVSPVVGPPSDED